MLKWSNCYLILILFMVSCGSSAIKQSSNSVNSKNDIIQVKNKINWLIKPNNDFTANDIVITPTTLVTHKEGGGYVRINNELKDTQMSLMILSTMMLADYKLESVNSIDLLSTDEKNLLKTIFDSLYNENDIIGKFVKNDKFCYLIFYKNSNWFLKTYFVQ